MRESTRNPQSVNVSRLGGLQPSGLRLFGSCLFVLCLFGMTANETFGQQDSEEPRFRIVVHQSNPSTSVPGDDIARIFMKKRSSWDGWDHAPLPIDRSNDSEVRKAFSQTIHGKSINALNNYWQRMIFSGRGVPPDTLRDDAEVFNAILANPGAVSYVTTDAKLPDGVKELKITDE